MPKNNELDDIELLLCRYLSMRKGRENAVSRADLCNDFSGVGERTLRRIIKHLVIKHNCPIGSCPQGYFWAVTPEEIEEVCAYYKNYALSSLLVVSRLKGIPMAHVCGQLTFEVMNEKE